MRLHLEVTKTLSQPMQSLASSCRHCDLTCPILLLSGVMTETRQVIQVPGAPPISIRIGARPIVPQHGAEAQQVSCNMELPSTLKKFTYIMYVNFFGCSWSKLADGLSIGDTCGPLWLFLKRVFCDLLSVGCDCSGASFVRNQYT